jgi:hypothetical protein
VIPTRGAIIPAAVGVDIGCGMAAVRTTLRANDLPDDLRQLRNSIERSIRSAMGVAASITACPTASTPGWCSPGWPPAWRRSRTSTAGSAPTSSTASWVRWAAATTSSNCAWTRRTRCG